MGIKSFVQLGVVSAALAAASFESSAVPIYDSAGFEASKFVAGLPLQGQDITTGPWLKDPGTSTATVTTSNPFAGSQAIAMTRVAGATGNTRWSVTKPTTPSAALSVFQVDFTMRVDQATFSGTPPTNTDFGPAFGVEAYDGITNILNPKLIGSLTVDATTGDVLIQQGGSGVLLETGTVVNRGVYNSFRLQFDFNTKQYSAFVNNTLVDTEPFVDNTAAVFTDAPIGTFAASASSVLTATGTGYFDNYSINVIPEPTAFGVGAVVLAGFAARRRRRPMAA